MKHLPPLAACALALLVAGCPTPAPLPPVAEAPPADASATPSAAPSDDASAAPSAVPSADASAAGASIKPSAAPKSTPTPLPGTYGLPFYMQFNHPATWAVTSEKKDPLRLEMKASYGDAVLQVREVRGTSDLKAQQDQVVALAGAGLVSNAALTLDKLKGYMIVWNRFEDGKSRHHMTRGFIYRESYFEIETSWNRPSDEMAQAEKDVTAILATWLWL